MKPLIDNPLTEGQSQLTTRAIVLLVDDQRMIAEGIRRMLADEPDLVFHYCSDPSKAVMTASQIKATTILQDLVMPDIDGMTLVRFYRANPPTKDIPVIVLSTKEDPKIKRQAFESGATDYLVKLPDKIELVARIRHHTKSYLVQKQRDEYFAELKRTQKRLEETNAKLERLSSLDGLTGLSNRRVFDENMKKTWANAISNNEEVSLVMMDIDHFKLYNDHYGHLGGDDCLKKVAAELQVASTRPGSTVARYGGEEFGVILPGATIDEAAEQAEKIRASIVGKKYEHAASKSNKFVTISLGIATLVPTPDTTPESLIAIADEGLYLAKEQGRNSVGRKQS